MYVIVVEPIGFVNLNSIVAVIAVPTAVVTEIDLDSVAVILLIATNKKETR